MATRQTSTIDPSEHLFSITFDENAGPDFDVAFLVPDLDEPGMQRHYMQAVQDSEPGLQARALGVSLYRPKKVKRVDLRAYLDHLMPQLAAIGVKYLMVCDAEYFRALSRNQGPENNLGHVLDTPEDWPGFHMIYCPNFKLAFSSPLKTAEGIAQAVQALTTHRAGTYSPPGQDVIHSAAYPNTPKEIGQWLEHLLSMECDLDADIETFSLKHWEAGLGTVGFSWSLHDGVSFAVDMLDNPADRETVRSMLRDFFRAWFHRAKAWKEEGYEPPRITWHNASFDITVIIYQLFMKDLLDQEGLLDGLEVMTEAFDDTRIIAYLATNSCAGNILGLKPLSQEFTGKYALAEIKNIRVVELDKLLRYNLIDCLATRYVKQKFWPIMVQDQQLEIYDTLFKPTLIDIIQMQLTGLPLDMSRVIEVKGLIEAARDRAVDAMRSLPFLDHFQRILRQRAADKYNATHVKKRKTADDFADPSDVNNFITFNPGSPDQLQEVLYDKNWLHLPVLGTSDAGNPTTEGAYIERLKHHTSDSDALAFLDALIDYKGTSKILTDFMPKFMAAPQGPDSWHYFFGNFNLGGTKSGRLSSSGPNLQNLPAGSKPWGKEIKSCFRAPPGKLLVGLDFSSLEDRISALQTRDPNKLKVYEDGYDGHCLRAHAYFGDQMPDIISDDVASINSIADKYKALRQDSKTPTFLLTYEGTHFGIVEKMGWPLEKAKKVEDRHNELYAASKKWVEDRRAEAGQLGYAVLAFGLRLRTPILRQVVLGNRATPYEAKQEGRTMGNALGQSWGLLNNRASVEFMRKVRAHPDFRLHIRQCAHIHDSQYFVMDEDMAVLLFINEHLVKAVQWQNDPLIWHDTVKLGGELSVFWPTWANEMVIPNGADEQTVRDCVSLHAEKLAAKQKSA